MIKLPKELPGVSELETMCANARAVARLCEALGVHPASKSAQLSSAALPSTSVQQDCAPADGAWILPEEID